MRSGFVAVLGRPNVGKSSLCNQMVGTDLAAVSNKPQTTWHQIRGIVTDERGQIVLTDTPGLHAATSELNRAMNVGALDALKSADTSMLILEAQRSLSEFEIELLTYLRGRKVLVVLNKTDLATAEQIERLRQDIIALGTDTILTCSAKARDGVDLIPGKLFELLPDGEYLYDPEDLTDRSTRFIVSEYIRQALFQVLGQELPYQIFVEIDTFDESADPLLIEATLHVGSKSQKPIVVGKNGSKIKEIGIVARKQIENLLDQHVYLRLWVKILPNWFKREGQILRAGLPYQKKRVKGVSGLMNDLHLDKRQEENGE